MEMEERTMFLKEMSIVAEAVANAFHPEKMNYELLGMGDAHLHWHLYPRVPGDLEGHGYNNRGPVWWYPMEKMYSEDSAIGGEKLEEMKSLLKNELDKLV